MFSCMSGVPPLGGTSREKYTTFESSGFLARSFVVFSVFAEKEDSFLDIRVANVARG